MRRKYLMLAVLVAIILIVTASVALAQGRVQIRDWMIVRQATVETTLNVNGATDLDGTLNVDGAAVLGSTLDTTGAVDFSSTLNVDGVSTLAGTVTTVGTEHLGVLPTIASAAVLSTTTDGAIFTITDGEIWIVHDVIVQVTTDFDCTGDNCTLIVGDGADTDGFITLADALLQAADTEYTGAPAGWQGLSAASKGVYLDEVTTNSAHRHVYAPSGADETIDVDVGGTDPVAGAAVVYIIYTRIQ